VWAPINSEIAAATNDRATYATWLEQLHLHATGDEFVIGCEASSLQWMRDRFGKVVQGAAGETPIRFVACRCERQEQHAPVAPVATETASAGTTRRPRVNTAQLRLVADVGAEQSQPVPVPQNGTGADQQSTADTGGLHAEAVR